MKNNTPKLRFPEFKNSGEWEEVKLCEILSYERPDKYIINGSIEDIGNTPVLTANKSFILGYTNETAGICKNYPVILFDDFTTDKKYVDFDFKIKSSAIKLLYAKPNNNLKYIYELMQTIKFNPQEHKRYYISYYQNLSVKIPILQEEQTKIANCFTSLDKLIGLEKEKLNKLQEHKKGLMQNLFPNNNEKQPKIRFPEFKDSGDWKEVFIKDTFIHYGGTSLEKYVVNNGTHKFISIGNYSTDGKYIDNGNRINLNEITSKKMLEKDNLVMILNDKTMDGKIIGACILIEEDNKYIYNQRSERLVCNDFILPLFAWYILNSSLIRNKIRNKSQGATQIYINYTSIESIKLYIPTSIKEQTKIANCLFLLDVEIDNQKLKIEKLEEHKKGLLQSLFI